MPNTNLTTNYSSIQAPLVLRYSKLIVQDLLSLKVSIQDQQGLAAAQGSWDPRLTPRQARYVTDKGTILIAHKWGEQGGCENGNHHKPQSRKGRQSHDLQVVHPDIMGLAPQKKIYIHIVLSF